MASVPKLWPSSTIVCLGSGPSLTQADVDFVRGKARVIAVSDAYRLAPWADVLYACDNKWWKWHHKNVRGLTALKYGMTVQKGLFADVQRLRNDGIEGLCVSPDGLRTGRNSGYQAINLAVHLGASRIVLLGYDMSRDHAQKKSHFFGEHPGNGLPSPYVSFVRMFPSLVKPLAALGVEVINCSRRTDLTAFPQMRLEDAFVAELAATG